MRIVSCTRAEAEQRLERAAEGWEHLRPERWEFHQQECWMALGRLWLGDVVVTAGHTTYRIQEAT